jgi:hypothetical protein
LALKTALKFGDPELQKFLYQLAERMKLFTFIAGLIAYVGKLGRLKIPLRHLIKPFRIQ